MTTTRLRKAAPDEPRAPVRYYRLRNKLKEKATGGAGDGSGKCSISLEALEAAEKLFAEAQDEYPNWVQENLDKLFKALAVCEQQPDKRPVAFEALNAIAHDMKGQGGTFGYPLVSLFGCGLHDITKEQDEIKDAHVQIARAHVDAMRAVVNGRVAGDGGEIGRELMSSLEAAIRKYSRAEDIEITLVMPSIRAAN